MRREGHAAGASLGARALCEPRRHAVEIERGGDEQVQQARLGEAAVARPAQVADGHTLGERPCDPGAGVVPRAELRRALAPPRVVERLIQRSGAESEGALAIGGDTALAGWAVAAIRVVEVDVDDVVAGAVPRRLPDPASTARRN